MKDLDPNILAQNLVAERELLGLSQGQVADALGLSRVRLNKLEKGLAPVRSSTLIRPLAHFYGALEINLTEELIEKPGFDFNCLPFSVRYLPEAQIESLVRDIRAGVVRAHDGKAPFLSNVVIRK